MHKIQVTVRVAQSLVFSLVSSSMHGLWLPLWYLQTLLCHFVIFLLAIALCVFPRITFSDNPLVSTNFPRITSSDNPLVSTNFPRITSSDNPLVSTNFPRMTSSENHLVSTNFPQMTSSDSPLVSINLSPSHSESSSPIIWCRIIILVLLDVTLWQ
jgi:hypothetical protein